MELKETINKFKAKLMLAMEPKTIDINSFGEIPKYWSFFMDSNNKWKSLSICDNTTTVLFKGFKDSEVSKHIHSLNDERTYVLSGNIEVVSKEGVKRYVEGESFFIEKNTEHIVYFIEDSLLMAIFTPKMKGLEIEFK
jgi:quercetin dioxygenase-like cupin family protein